MKGRPALGILVTFLFFLQCSKFPCSALEICDVDCLKRISQNVKPPPPPATSIPIRVKAPKPSNLPTTATVPYNATLFHGSYQRRMEFVHDLGSAIMLFTHIRRAGGTVLEDYVLKPYMRRIQGTQYLCKEGELARFYRMSETQLKPYKDSLRKASLVWRHCPFGLHSLLAPDQPFVYVTLIRNPLERMNSWFAYCDKYSPDKCHTTKTFAKSLQPGESKVSAFYRTRQKLYSSTTLPKSRPSGTFHPNNLEYRLDDNYQTRMVCGPTAHDHAIPLGQEHVSCALKHLDQHFAFVGVTERYEESICVMAKMFNLPQDLTRVKNDKATTGSSHKALPADFVENWGKYATHDQVLHDYANFRLNQDLDHFTACSKSSKYEPPSALEMKRYLMITRTNSP